MRFSDGGQRVMVRGRVTVRGSVRVRNGGGYAVGVMVMHDRVVRVRNGNCLTRLLCRKESYG